MRIVDRVALGEPRVTADGYLVADARIARTGIQTYLGAEVGRPDLAIVRVFRPEAEVFAADAMKSFAHRPVTDDHPPDQVTAETWRKVAIGNTGGEVARDGDFLRVPLVLMDAGAIETVRAGKRELSCGYDCELDWTPGTAPDGAAYDARQVHLRGNHVAIVDAGRAGPHCRIGDTTNPTPHQDETPAMTLKTVTVDGIPVEVTDQGATVIATLQGRLTDAASQLSDAGKAHATALAAKDAEIAKKDAEIDALKAKVLTDADIDKRVTARAGLVDTARRIAPDVKTDGLTDAAIRRAVVVAKVGDAILAGKPDAYVDARFDLLVEDLAVMGSDPIRDTLRTGQTSPHALGDTEKAYAAMLAHDANAWKGINPLKPEAK